MASIDRQAEWAKDVEAEEGERDSEMPASDARVAYLVDCVETLTGRRGAEDLAQSDEVQRFLDDPACRALHVGASGSGDGARFAAALEQSGGGRELGEAQVHFVKLGGEQLDADNISRCVSVTSAARSPLDALYHSLHNVFAPELLSNPAWSARIGQDVQALLSKLDAGLESAVRAQQTEGERPEAVFSPLDELAFWEDRAAVARGSEKRRAAAFAKVLGKLREPLSAIDRMGLSELYELVEEAQAVLDDLWRLDQDEGFPQARMEQLFRTFGAAIMKRCVQVLGKHNIWDAPFARLRADVEDTARVCERWTLCVTELTGRSWSQLGGDRAWQSAAAAAPPDDEGKGREEDYDQDGHGYGTGTGFRDDAMEAFAKRLDDILRLRMTVEELRRLLSLEEQQSLEVDQAFTPFSRLQPLFANRYTEPLWDAAVIEFEKNLAPAERNVAKKLAQRVRATAKDKSAGPQVLLGEFARYRSLAGRPEVRRALQSERETALARVAAYVDELDGEFESRSHKAAAEAARACQGAADRPAGSVPGSRNLSPTVNAIVWGKQLSASVEAILSASVEILDDLAAFERLQDAAQSLLGRIESWISDVFRDWCVSVEDLLEDGELSLQLTGRLMEIDMEGILQVNFSERLVTLLREVRQLGEMGLSVPSKLKKAVQVADKYYRYGVMLKKTANFFNSMETQIIGSQKAMLFEALVAFEEEVTNPKLGGGSKKEGKLVTWGDPSECQAYVHRLQLAVDKLSGENRRLHKTHERLGVQVVRLMDIDMLRQADRWKQSWGKLATTMAQLEGTYEPKRMAKWKLHWDHQVYKSLEASYRMGLESLNENLGEIKGELVFSNHRLQFRPPIEELRTTYYRKMKKFIAMPASFQGFSGGSVAKEVFGRMAERNAGSLIMVYRKAETLFERLERLSASMQPYVVLGTVTDLDALVEQTCVECADWEANFRTLKTKRRELDKVQDFYKVDCVSISTSALKMAVEEQLSRLSDALLLSLRKSVLTVLRDCEAYLDRSMERLSKRPENIQEISEATAESVAIAEAKGDWQAKWSRSEERRKLLLSVASSAGQHGSAIDLTELLETQGRLPSKWENFEVALVAFSDMIEDQRESLKARVDDDVADCRQKVAQFVSRWEQLKPGKEGIYAWSDSAIRSIFEELEEWQAQFEEVKAQAETCASNCLHFELPRPQFEALEEVEKDFEGTQREWGQFKVFSTQLDELKAKDWLSFRANLYDAEDLARHWLDSMKGKARGVVLDHIAAICTSLRKAVPALKFMRGEPYKEEHWSTLFRKLGMPKGVSLQTLTFGHFVDVLDAVADNLQFAKDMTARAQGEVTIREAITELKSWAETASVEMMDHEEMGRVTPLIKNWKDVLTELGDNQSLLASLKESQYFRPFEQQAAVYETNMAALDEFLGMMNQIQRKWLYLEPIFGRGALPSEASRFKRIDEDWVDIMNKLAPEPLLFNLCDEAIFPRMETTLRTMVDQLERCQKALADFLEEKRSRLPRFYFIGDDDLLEILGQAKNPAVIQSHLKKLFQGIHSVVFDEGHANIVAICSAAGEQVDLESPVAVTDHVEVWLQNLSDEMRRTLQAQLVRCVHDKQVNLGEFPSQVLSLAESIKFTSRCEHAIKQNKIPSLRKLLKKTLAGYTGADLSARPLSQLKVKALILDLVHNIDVCDQLERNGVNSVEDWHWDKQLRYYLNSENECVVRMCDAEIKYTYEYWGNAAKLVHTPLTDKCYLTLTQGMHMGFGGSPYGPAGTGKTESVKALGNCLGRQVLVFNCDEGIDFHSMGRIFTGLVKCGAWGCFDEFNRLKEDQLSAVSQQIQVIQAAIKERRPSLKLLGKSIDVDHNAGIFVTMNPAGKGYGGRSKLPDNLKQLFRPVAMSRPDNNLIAEVILYSEGFQEAKDLGQKLVSLYKLSKELLSPQLHYDWGLRAMKAVLNTGGKLVLEHKKAAGGAALSLETEREVLIKAIRVNTLSKLTFVDSKAFLGLIGDVFPGAESRDVAYEELENAIKDVMRAPPFSLEPSDGQVRKMLQLKESLDQRMGCVVVGPSGCGKSTLWKVLREALKRTGQVVKTHVMNPKSMPRERLLGYMDMDTREWFDGVLTHAARQVVKEPKETRSWIVCDGDVDPEWIESLNSVLDDNKLLTMPNGERISLSNDCSLILRATLISRVHVASSCAKVQ